MAKITKATFKSFLKKNSNVLIKCKSDFDPMTDGVVYDPNATFSPLLKTDHPHENNLGYQGVWLVGGSRDLFQEYNKNGLVGIEVWNCCGSFVVARKA